VEAALHGGELPFVAERFDRRRLAERYLEILEGVAGRPAL